jgi:hypothetical protein
MLAEGLEALARALDTMAVELPPAGWRDVGAGDSPAREGELWTTTEVVGLSGDRVRETAEHSGRPSTAV